MSNVGKSNGKNVPFSKGLIIGFFTVFLIIYGIFISSFIEDYPKYNIGEFLPMFMNYIPLVCYIGAIFLGFALVIFIRNTTVQKSREIQSRKKSKTGSAYREALFLVIFFVTFIPLFGPIFDQGVNDQNFSVYNEKWNGASDFKTAIEGDGYNVMTIQSSLSATERLDKSILLILLGPNLFYNPIFEIPYFMDFFDNTTRNSLFICHDHGSTSTLLWEIFIASALDPHLQGTIPVTIFANGILRDNGSYYVAPDFPVIQSFSAHPTTVGISDVILSEASAVVGGPFLSFFGWDLVGSSTEYGYVDKDGDHMYNFDYDFVDLSLIGGALPGFPSKWPLGGYSQGVFMAKDAITSRVFVSADASLFNNELIAQPGYDNLQFGLNIVNWLTYGEPKEDWIIVFDEAHIRPEFSRDLTSAGIFGFITQYIIHLSTNPITAWIYPILAIYSLKKYLPKKDEKSAKKKADKQDKKEEREKFRTSSFFAEKIEWYREKSRYGKALTLLYRRLERKLNALLRGQKITTKNVIALVISKEPKTSKIKIKRISKFMDTIIAIKEGKSKVKNEQEFENLYFEMEWVVNNV
ncbi:MAG TPA: hypothetical protein VMV43_04810 [Candidatus Nanopelagicaceae bacterium]|nr:hypothetical protein [Candidatus Nanopelagicaceae bacterium]